jgi:imidazolonepropionase-like amidohydrolase
MLALLFALTSSPANGQSPPPGETIAYKGGTVIGMGKATVVVANGKIVAVGGEVPEGATVSDISGKCIGPGFIDSHVHLALRPESKSMAEGGVVAAIDMGSTLAFLADPPTELEVWSSGPMMTAFGGYPVNSWGKDGYGREVLGPSDAKVGVNQLADAGAKLIKVPFAKGARLTDRELGTIVEAAHQRDLKVVAHALDDAAASRAATNGCDVLAHVPREPLSDATVELWRNRAVISTLKAFGGSDAAIDNLKRLRAAGATVLYGTDFGNSKTAGIDPEEIALMKTAGMTIEEIRASATTIPARFWGLDGYGAVEVGKKDALWIGDCACAWCE